jgi:hypothetical protein
MNGCEDAERAVEGGDMILTAEAWQAYLPGPCNAHACFQREQAGAALWLGPEST